MRSAYIQRSSGATFTLTVEMFSSSRSAPGQIGSPRCESRGSTHAQVKCRLICDCLRRKLRKYSFGVYRDFKRFSYSRDLLVLSQGSSEAPGFSLARHTALTQVRKILKDFAVTKKRTTDGMSVEPFRSRAARTLEWISASHHLFWRPLSES